MVTDTPSATPGPSRAATERLLELLHTDHGDARTWLRFWRATFARSLRQARAHPAALAQVTGLHLLVATAASPRGRVWAGASWALSSLHLGMLEGRSTLGWANLLTLARANLPALDRRLGSWLPVVAALTDVADGVIARGTNTVTPFGRDADFLTDTALWIWYTLRHDPSRTVQIAAVIAWGLPVAAVTAASFGRGGMVDIPRSRWLRPCAALQAVICARACTRALHR